MSIREFFEKEFNYYREEDGCYGKVIDCAVVGLREAYIAYEVQDRHGRRDVIAVVCLLNFKPNDYFNFGYKDMEETAGPYCWNCPERILKLLTPTDHETANRWRQACWERINRKKSLPKLKKGMVIEFSSPIEFGSGIKDTVFTVLDPRWLVFQGRHVGRCRIRRSTLQGREWKVVQQP